MSIYWELYWFLLFVWVWGFLDWDGGDGDFLDELGVWFCVFLWDFIGEGDLEGVLLWYFGEGVYDLWWWFLFVWEGDLYISVVLLLVFIIKCILVNFLK